jgi:3-oxoacyl-[acyl-carrier-protein] synthase III
VALASIKDIKINAISVCLPSNIEDNEKYAYFSNDIEKNLFIKSVGIRYRRVADKGICTSDLCLKASEKILEQNSFNKEEIKALIFVSQTPDYITPATSIILQGKLGLSASCLAFDINLGCSGYVYGLFVLSSLLKQIGSGKALLLAGDISTACISERDKSTAPIFSDAGSATLIGFEEGSEEMFFNLESIGQKHEAILIPDGGYRNPFKEESLLYRKNETGLERNKLHLMMNGHEVFSFSTQEVVKNIQYLLEKINKDISQVDYTFLHQANKLINESIRKKLNIDKEKLPYTLHDYGNTSSATIPLTMIDFFQKNTFETSRTCLISGFGVGLSIASAIIKLDKNTKFYLEEI